MLRISTAAAKVPERLIRALAALPPAGQVGVGPLSRRAGEEERLAVIRHFVDHACDRIRAGELDATAARDLAADVRFQAGLLIPDQMGAYDLIYGSRFARLIEQFALRPSPGDGTGSSAAGVG